jgi:hypothetical protein
MKRIKNLIRKFDRWFDFNLSWFFINGNKVDKWREHLDKKYNLKKEKNNGLR